MIENVVSVDPVMVTEVNAENLRVGKQLLTPDGWQTIKGLVMFADADQVSVYTDERDDVETSGWPLHFGDRVHTRLTPTDEQNYQAKRRARIEQQRLRRLAMEAAGCPDWCDRQHDQHDNSDGLCHASVPISVPGAEVYSGKPKELGFWLERRDNQADGSAETVIVIETRPHAEDLEFTAEVILQLAGKLSSLGHRGGLFDGRRRR